MIEEVFANIYKIEIPLPGNPLKAINSYVIKASERNLIVDTGLNRKECMDAMQVGLRELEVNLKETDFFITHSHADHFALVPDLVTETSHIYFNRPDAEKLQYSIRWSDMGDHACLNGFPEKDLKLALSNHPGQKHGSKFDLSLIFLKENDWIHIGGYHFQCVETPGHTKGHICLYEPDKKLLLSGDHILGDITPIIQSWTENENPLHEYLCSLDKIYEIDVELVLPGHRRIFKTCKERILELKRHHQKRVEEILSILKKGRNNAFEVASEMEWDIDCESWNQFPISQKWFATGETIAHLKYLEEKEMARREIVKGKIMYTLTSD